MYGNEANVVIWKELRQKKRDLQGPVPTRLLADQVGYSERQMRRIMNSLADLGVVQKVGCRKGWVPVGREYKPRRLPEQCGDRVIQLPLPLFFDVA